MSKGSGAGFKRGRPAGVILVSDEASRVAAAMLRRLLPDWQLRMVEDRAWLTEGADPDVAVGIVIPPLTLEQGAELWIERAAQARPDLLWTAVVGERHCEDPQFMRVVAATCHDFFVAPLTPIAASIPGILGHALGIARLRAQLRTPASGDAGDHGMVGNSPPMKRLDKLITKFAQADSPVMIGGESGTGKELVARAIHRASARKAGRFIVVNCGAIPENLFESELFGHVKGAFTGALKDREGKVAIADGGTLFLDEIGDLSLAHQVKLLRFLQDGSYEPVGSSHSSRVDVRIVAATHVDLTAAVRDQRFREDLFYRLSVLPMQVPPLRARGQDIELLAEHFLAQPRLSASAKARSFSRDARQALYLHQWPGNVRELINRVGKAAIMAEGPLITPGDLDLPNVLTEAGASVVNLQEAREHAERQAVEQALRDSSFNVSQAAGMLGVSRMTIYRLLDKHGIEID